MFDYSRKVSLVLNDICAIPREYMYDDMILDQFCSQQMLEDIADGINRECGTRIKAESIDLNMTIGQLYQVVNSAAANESRYE
jgi:hypothetical protein